MQETYPPLSAVSSGPARVSNISCSAPASPAFESVGISTWTARHLTVQIESRRGVMKVRLAEQTTTINAPRSQVFRMFSSFGENPRTGESGEQATVMERHDNRLVVAFISRQGRKLYRTLEEVHLYPDERITFRHLNGPLHYAREEFRLAEIAGGTQITYQGEIECRMPLLPGIGWLTALLYVRPKYGSVVKRHMGRLKETAEAEHGGAFELA